MNVVDDMKKLKCKMDSTTSTVKITFPDGYEPTFQYINHPPGENAKSKKKKTKKRKIAEHLLEVRRHALPHSPHLSAQMLSS